MVLTGPPIEYALWSTMPQEEEAVMIHFRNPAYITEKLFHQ
jgi:hypothetical protein